MAEIAHEKGCDPLSLRPLPGGKERILEGLGGAVKRLGREQREGIAWVDRFTGKQSGDHIT